MLLLLINAPLAEEAVPEAVSIFKILMLVVLFC
jgi:hypothetical protein